MYFGVLNGSGRWHAECLPFLLAMGSSLAALMLVASVVTTPATAPREIVQSAVFATSVSRWLTLANGLLIATLACAGLIAYVMTTEHVVHVIEVVERPSRETA